jgi:N-glycosylase/DNA lyase
MEKNMDIKVGDDIDLRKIAYSGQCFRWRELSDGSFLIVAFGTYVIASQHDDVIKLESKYNIDGQLWIEYFDLNRNYREIVDGIDHEDSFLYNAGQYGRGVRILKQDAFETLISFIISQRKSIPAIKTSIEKICSSFGRDLGVVEGEKVYAFPTPQELYLAPMDKLEECSLGYRLPYVMQAARHIYQEPDLLDKMNEMSDEDLKETLLSFYGVGDKVASCTMLFGFGRLNTFPIDVWIRRALEQKYRSGFPFERYKPYNGIMQQYIFEYYRGKHNP